MSACAYKLNAKLAFSQTGSCVVLLPIIEGEKDDGSESRMV